MEYIKCISLKAIGIGLLFGYVLPIAILKLLTIALYKSGVQSIFGTFPALLTVYILVIAPLVSGYLGAKHSKITPLLNGMLATLTGMLLFLVFSELGGAVIYFVFCITTIGLGFVGTRRFIRHG